MDPATFPASSQVPLSLGTALASVAVAALVIDLFLAHRRSIAAALTALTFVLLVFRSLVSTPFEETRGGPVLRFLVSTSTLGGIPVVFLVSCMACLLLAWALADRLALRFLPGNELLGPRVFLSVFTLGAAVCATDEAASALGWADWSLGLYADSANRWFPSAPYFAIEGQTLDGLRYYAFVAFLMGLLQAPRVVLPPLLVLPTGLSVFTPLAVGVFSGGSTDPSSSNWVIEGLNLGSVALISLALFRDRPTNPLRRDSATALPWLPSALALLTVVTLALLLGWGGQMGTLVALLPLLWLGIAALPGADGPSLALAWILAALVLRERALLILVPGAAFVLWSRRPPVPFEGPRPWSKAIAASAATLAAVALVHSSPGFSRVKLPAERGIEEGADGPRRPRRTQPTP